MNELTITFVVVESKDAGWIFFSNGQISQFTWKSGLASLAECDANCKFFQLKSVFVCGGYPFLGDLKYTQEEEEAVLLLEF